MKNNDVQFHTFIALFLIVMLLAFWLLTIERRLKAVENNGDWMWEWKRDYVNPTLREITK